MTRDSSDAGIADSTLAEPSMTGSARLSDFGLFFRKFLSKGRGISSAVPSSRAMSENVLQFVDFNRPATLVELGAGTGAVTELILDRLRPHHRFAAVENDPDFCQVLRRRFPDMHLIQTDATRVREPLEKLGMRKVDYVLSGLPTPNLPRRSVVRLWRWLRECLAPDGVFVQITVAPLLYRGFYDRLFQSVKYRMVWLNVPPGGVYCCAAPRKRLAPRNDRSGD